MSEKDTLGFEKVKAAKRGEFIKGVAAAVSIDNTIGPVILMAPDLPRLHAAFEKITNHKMLEEYCIFSLTSLGQVNKVDSTDKTIDKETELYYWWYLPDEKGCGIESKDCKFNGKEAYNLGLVVKKTERECKRLLSKHGLTMKEINRIHIDTISPDDIPF